MKLGSVCLLLCAVLTGCGTPFRLPKQAKTPEVMVSDKGAVAVTGDAEKPAKVSSKTNDAVLPIPEGSTFVFNEKLGTMTLTMAKASQMALNRKETVVEGPKAFEPEKQPTLKEQSEAKSDFWTALGLKAGLVLGFSLAIFGLVRGWDLVMYGGAAIGLGCAFGIFIERNPIILSVIGLGAAAAVIGPWIYHTKIKHLENNPPNDHK